jgi:hypothetical protein
MLELTPLLLLTPLFFDPVILSPRSEHESMKQENAVRKEQGIPLRGSYYE